MFENLTGEVRAAAARKGKGKGRGKSTERPKISWREALANAGKGRGKGKGKAAKAKPAPTRRNTTKPERKEVIDLIRQKDTNRILKKPGRGDALSAEKSRVWGLVEEAFNADRSGKDKLSRTTMMGVYKRYRTEKRQKVDTGIVNSQESGFSLIENAQPMADQMPSDSSDEGSDENLDGPDGIER